MKLSRSVLLGLSLVVTLCVGCADWRALEYNVGVANCTPDILREARLRMGEYQHTFGALGVKATAMHLLVREPLADHADLEWNSAEGSPRTAKVVVRAALPSDFGHDEIVFEICPGDRVVLRSGINPANAVRPLGTWRDHPQAPCLCDVPGRAVLPAAE